MCTFVNDLTATLRLDGTAQSRSQDKAVIRCIDDGIGVSFRYVTFEKNYFRLLHECSQ
jgi:hypothetical protein